MTEVNIEIYTEEYRHQVAALIIGIQIEEFDIPITLDAQPDLADIPGFYQVGGGNFWIARMDDKVVGTIALKDISDGQGALRKMFVDRAHRGSEWNLGKKLLDALINWAETKNFKEIFLGTTAKFIAAQRFYQKNGFVEVEKQALPGSFPLMEVDTKFYRYPIIKPG